MDNSFYDICIVMEKAGTNNPTEQTVYQFYKRVEYYEKKYMKESARK